MKTADTLPLVSIVCESYNHEPFLRRCLDGFVMQKTDFPFEILIHDDASTDRSADIIREYESKYPGLFKPIYQKENQYSKGVIIWADIQFPRAKGKYIALCEGDDYWTDPLKLQKQVDYMEVHPECSLCFHNALIHWENGEREDKLFAVLEDRDYSGEEFCKNWITPTASFLFRRSIVQDYPSLLNKTGPLVFGDRPLSLLCAHKGKTHAFPEPMCVYTKHEGAYTADFNAGKILGQGDSWEKMISAFGGDFSDAITKQMINSYILAMIRGLQEKKYSVTLKAIYRGIIRHPLLATKVLLAIPYERKATVDKV